VNRSPLFYKILRSLRPLTKVFGLHDKIEKDWQMRQELLQYPTACQLLFQRQQPELEAELLQNRLPLMEVPVLILQGGQDLLDAVVKSQTYTQLIPKVEFKMIPHAANDLSKSCAGIVAGDIKDFPVF